MKWYVLFLFVVVCTAKKSKKKHRTSPHWLENGVYEIDRNLIVMKHNDLRMELAQEKVPRQPKGINLKRLSWDRSLADQAQKIANKCKLKHKIVNDSRFHVGQSMAESYSADYSLGAGWERIIQLWFDEYKLYTYPNDATEKTGDYTQIVWADTEFIGCGYTYYEKDDDDVRYHKMYVCNYGPGGNIIEKWPYEFGEFGCENLC